MNRASFCSEDSGSRKSHHHRNILVISQPTDEKSAPFDRVCTSAVSAFPINYLKRFFSPPSPPWRGWTCLEPISSPPTSLQPSAATRQSAASLCKEDLFLPTGFSFFGLNGGNKHVGSDFSHQRFIPSAICRQAESFSFVCSGRTAPSSGLTLQKEANSLPYPTPGGCWYKKQCRGFQGRND